MTDLYRRLLNDLTERFGGTIDDANADAIAYAAAELYHKDFEPRLWQEKSAHDLLDLLGVPRAGVFAPYSLSDRLVLFQRRSSQAQYVARAHEVLTALGVPRTDEEGVEQSVKWRLEQVLAAINGDGTEDEEEDDEEGDDPMEDGSEAKNGAQDAGSGDASQGNGRDVVTITSGFAPLARESSADTDGFAPLASEEPKNETETAAGSAEPDVSHVELAAAVRVLEHAADLEEQLATPPEVDRSAGVDLVSLAESLTGIQGEIAALRDLVEAFEIGMRRQFDELQAQLRAGGGLGVTLAPAAYGPAPLLPRPVDPTREMPPVVVDEPVVDDRKRGKGRRRVLLVVLLTLLGVLLAGVIVAGVTVGWDAIRP